MVTMNLVQYSLKALLDINRLENVFSMIVTDLYRQPITNNITNETKKEIFARTKQYLLSFHYEKIGKLIPSMERRI